MKALCVILGVLSASALKHQTDTEGYVCKFAPWECDEFTEFIDDFSMVTDDSGNDFQPEYSISRQSENRGNSELVCPNFDQPDVDALVHRATQGPVKVDPAFLKNRSAQAPKRIILFILMEPLTGSTGVSSFVATSPQLSTLCRADTWACEGTWILAKQGLILGYDELNRWDPDQPKDWNTAVHAYSSFWDMSQRVHMDKSPPNIAKAKHIHDQLKKKGEEVKFIMITRSPCLKKHNSIEFMQMMIQARKDLDDDSLLHLRYEDLLRDPYASASKILDFLPELESIDPSKYGLEQKFGGRNLSMMGYIKARGHFENFHAQRPMDAEWEEFAKIFEHTV